MIGEVVNNTQMGKRYSFTFLLIALIGNCAVLGNRLILHKELGARNAWNTVTGHMNVKAKESIYIALQEQQSYKKELNYCKKNKTSEYFFGRF